MHFPDFATFPEEKNAGQPRRRIQVVAQFRLRPLAPLAPIGRSNRGSRGRASNGGDKNKRKQPSIQDKSGKIELSEEITAFFPGIFVSQLILKAACNPLRRFFFANAVYGLRPGRGAFTSN